MSTILVEEDQWIEDSKGKAMEKWILVNQTRLPLLCEKSGAILLVLVMNHRVFETQMALPGSPR